MMLSVFKRDSHLSTNRAALYQEVTTTMVVRLDDSSKYFCALLPFLRQLALNSHQRRSQLRDFAEVDLKSW
jgi:hypothetical protein